MNTLIIIAIIAGPIFAVQVQKLIEKLTQRKQAKEGIFKVLMSTRGTRLSPVHVQALNMIDLEFYGKRKKNKAVVDAWRLYLDQLASGPQDPQAPDYQTNLHAWQIRSSEVFYDMLFAMASSLNYDFDKVLLMRGAYMPTGHGEAEFDQLIIRKGLVDLSLGKTSIPIHITGVPDTKKAEPSQKEPSESSPTS